MSVNLQKENIRLCEVVCPNYCRTTVEGDVIVPDIKPDIKKVLQVDNSVVINQKNVQSDKIYIQGTVNINILYAPEDAETGAVKAISTSREFNHSIDVKGAGQEMELCVDAEIEPAEYTLVNSRKLSVRSKVGMSARLLGVKEVELATGIDDEEPIEVQGKLLQLYNPGIDTSRDIIIRERLEVPAGKPDICEILKVSAKPSTTSICTGDASVEVKGELKICTIYCGEGSISPEVMEHIIPFAETLEIDGVTERMNGEVDYCVKDISYEVCQDSDGDRKLLSFEISILTTVRAFETIECKAIEDAYGIKHPIETKKTEYSVEKMIGCANTQITTNEAIMIPDYLPEIKKLCDCEATPTVENVLINDETVTVSGYISCALLYMSESEDTPISGFAHIIPFNHCFDMPGICETAVCDARAEVEHINCTINDGRSLQARAIVSIGIKAVAPCTVEVVSEIQCDKEQPLAKAPSMIVYFVQKGDTLWDIAKRYSISKESILATNGDNESELIRPGKCIYIFR